GTVASFAGDIVISTAVGNLTAPVTGTLDVATGAFTSSSTTVTGSERRDTTSGDGLKNGPKKSGLAAPG
ncbi:MAG: hypothetical protein ABIQ53_10150, partial [Terracoccus sp.]